MEFLTTLFQDSAKVHITDGEPSEQVKLILEDGRQAVESKDYCKAIRAYSQIIPPTSSSLFLRGCARLKLCDFTATQAAIEDFDKAIKMSRSSKTDKTNEDVAELSYKRGFAYQSVGQYEHAIADFDEIIKHIGKPPELVHRTLFNRALAYESMNELKKALTDINKANELNPNDAYYLYCQARIHTLLGRKTDAETDLTQAATLEQGKSPQSLFHQGVVQYAMNKFEKAQDLFDAVLTKYTMPEDDLNKAETYFYRALTSYALGKKEKASEDLEEAIKCNRKHARAHFRLGMIQAHDFNLFHEALENYNIAHRLAPHQPDILYERGGLNFKLGRLDIGINDKRRALQLKSVYSESAEMYYKNMLKRAKDNLNQHGDSTSTDLHVAVYQEKLIDYGSDKDRDGRYHETVNAYKKAIKADEEANRYPYARPLLMFCHQKEGELFEAFSVRELLDEKLEEKDSVMQQAWDKIMQLFRNASQDFGDKFALTQEQIKIISMIDDNNTSIQDGYAYFRKADKANNNENLITFYTIMRRSLAHVFAAISIVSAGGETQIVKHNVKGKKARIGTAVRVLSQVVGSLLPHGGNLVSSTGRMVAGSLEKRDYKEHQKKFRTISLIGDPEELRGVAIKIAREVTDRYIKQIGSLKNENKSVPFVSVGSCTCRSGKWKELLPFVDELNEKEPVRRVAIFGANYTTIALRDITATKLGLSYKTTKEELVDIFVRLICNAQGNTIKEILRKAHLDPNELLPHNYQGADGEWNLYEFYRKPGIRVDEEAEDRYKDQLASYMDPDIYGYRLGTIDELHNLQDKNKIVEDTVKNET